MGHDKYSFMRHYADARVATSDMSRVDAGNEALAFWNMVNDKHYTETGQQAILEAAIRSVPDIAALNSPEDLLKHLDDGETKSPLVLDDPIPVEPEPVDDYVFEDYDLSLMPEVDYHADAAWFETPFEEDDPMTEPEFTDMKITEPAAPDYGPSTTADILANRVRGMTYLEMKAFTENMPGGLPEDAWAKWAQWAQDHH